MSAQTSVLFVCLGNICRSPTAEAVFRARLAACGLSQTVRVDSAGTGDWHVGKVPDKRTQVAAKQRGYDLSSLRARQVHPDDFSRFDYLLAMDRNNLADLKRLAPADFAGHLGLFLDFAHADIDEVPDPYYGGAEGFDQVLDLVERAVEGLIAELRTSLR